MKAIQLAEPRRFEVVDIQPPGDPDPGEAIVKTHCVGICGTDYSGYLGKMPFFSYPRIPGHELGVEVVAVGKDVTHVRVGDRCSVEPYMNCGHCYACRKGNSNCCSNLRVIGVMIDGGLCEEFRIRADKLHPAKELTFEQLALVETLAIGCHASHRGMPDKDQHALIIGAGPIGLATLEFVRLTGAKVTIMDRVQSRLDFCTETYGVQATVCFEEVDQAIEAMQGITDGDLFSVVIDATGNQDSMAHSLRYLAPTGTVVYVGITTGEIRFAHPTMHRPEATIKASRNALPSDFVQIIDDISRGVIDTEPWITHRTTFSRMIGEFEKFSNPESGVIKAVIDVVAE